MPVNPLRFALVSLVFVSLSGTASATLLSWSATMDGLQEVPPNVSPGSGFVTGTLDDVTGAVTLTSGPFSGLIGTSSAAHIHGLAGFGVAAGVLITLSPTIGVTSGTITGGGVLSAPHVVGMKAGLTYVNLHTTVFPGGEIRGQIAMDPVPEPATFALIGSALAVAARRKRRISASAV